LVGKAVPRTGMESLLPQAVKGIEAVSGWGKAALRVHITPFATKKGQFGGTRVKGKSRATVRAGRSLGRSHRSTPVGNFGGGERSFFLSGGKKGRKSGRKKGQGQPLKKRGRSVSKSLRKRLNFLAGPEGFKLGKQKK